MFVKNADCVTLGKLQNDIPSRKQITFNDIPRLTHLTNYPRRRLHLFVIILKQYACKCLNKKLNRQEFQRKAVLQWQIEKCALPYVTDQSINQSINQSITHSVTQSINNFI